MNQLSRTTSFYVINMSSFSVEITDYITNKLTGRGHIQLHYRL